MIGLVKKLLKGVFFGDTGGEAGEYTLAISVLVITCPPLPISRLLNVGMKLNLCSVIN